MSFAPADVDGSLAHVMHHETNRNRKTGRIVGVLYIIGTVAGVSSALITQPVLNTADYLARISANENPITLGALLVLTMGFALALVSVLLFPILRKHQEALALGYVVFRGALEMVCYLALAICWLFLIQVGRETAVAGASGAAYIHSLGAFMLYSMLYQSQLVPRWISVWGFIGILLHLCTALLTMFRILSSDTVTLINLPILLQEMVMAIWLIVKGFSPTAVTSPRWVQKEVL